MQEYAYPDQKVFIKTHKGYVTSEKIVWQIGKYRQIIPNDLIKTYKGNVTSNKKMGKSTKKGQKIEDYCQNAHLNRHACLKRATSLHRCTFWGLYLLV